MMHQSFAVAFTPFDKTPMDFLNFIQSTILARPLFQLKTISRSIQDVPIKQPQAQRGGHLDLYDALKVLHLGN